MILPDAGRSIAAGAGTGAFESEVAKPCSSGTKRLCELSWALRTVQSTS